MLAQKHLLTCELKRSQCRRTERHKFVGQNIEFVKKRPEMKPVDAMNEAMDLWWNENINITFIQEDNNYSSIRMKKRSAEYRRFAQMACAKSYALGCAVLETSTGFYITCLYALENLDNHAVYTRGDLRSKCKIQSIKFDGLCGADENYLNFQQHGTRAYFEVRPTPNPPVKQWKDNGRSLFGKKSSAKSPKAAPKPSKHAKLQTSDNTATATVTGTFSASPLIDIRYNGQQDMLRFNQLSNTVTRQFTSSTSNFPLSDSFQQFHTTNANDFRDVFGKFVSTMPVSNNIQIRRRVTVSG